LERFLAFYTLILQSIANSAKRLLFVWGREKKRKSNRLTAFATLLSLMVATVNGHTKNCNPTNHDKESLLVLVCALSDVIPLRKYFFFPQLQQEYNLHMVTRSQSMMSGGVQVEASPSSPRVTGVTPATSTDASVASSTSAAGGGTADCSAMKLQQQKRPPPPPKSETSLLTEDDEYEGLTAIDDLVEAEQEKDDHEGQHPALRSMCVIMTSQNRRIVPNSAETYEFENDIFFGKVMLMVRTPDVDHPYRDKTVLGETPKRVSQYMKGKKRRFEFQFQIKLKRVPTGPLFLGCELEKSIKVGAITKGLVNILLAMVRRINPGFHYSWGTDPKSISPADLEAGHYEKTHLSFPVEASMDRIVISKPGETPPELGHELYESNESVKRRRRMGFGSVEWNLEDTYTMCLWSAYCDWIKWKSLNVPGVSPFSLSRVTGTQPIYLCVYELPKISPEEYRKSRPPHTRSDLSVYSRFEFSHADKTVGGYAEALLGKSRNPLIPSDQSLPDTESLSSEFETRSRITVL
jgi:hypothetical protein